MDKSNHYFPLDSHESNFDIENQSQINRTFQRATERPVWLRTKVMPVVKREDDSSFDRHPDESRDPALCHVSLTWIPAYAGMTLLAVCAAVVHACRNRAWHTPSYATADPKHNNADYVYDYESLKAQPKFRKEELYVKKLIFVTILCTFVWLGMAGCCGDCPTCPDNRPPVEKDYHFLYSFVGSFSTASVVTYSTKSGEAVDSANYGRYPFNDVRFSKDGMYAYYTVNESENGSTWVTETVSGDTISIVNGVWSQWLQLFDDERHLLLAGGGTYLRILNLPTLDVVYAEFDSSGWGEGAVHPTLNIAYIPLPAEDSLLVLRMDDSGVDAEKFALKNLDGLPCGAISAQSSLDGKYLLLTAGDFPSGRGYTQVRDLNTLELLKQYSRYPISRPYFHPDARRIFFREWVRWEENNPGAIWMLDLETFLLERVIDGSDIVGSGSPRSALNPSDMDFTPDGRYAIISNGVGLGAFGPILKVDLESYRIVDTIYPALGFPRVIRMNPKPM